MLFEPDCVYDPSTDVADPVYVRTTDSAVTVPADEVERVQWMNTVLKVAIEKVMERCKIDATGSTILDNAHRGIVNNYTHNSEYALTCAMVMVLKTLLVVVSNGTNTPDTEWMKEYITKTLEHVEHIKTTP